MEKLLFHEPPRQRVRMSRATLCPRLGITSADEGRGDLVQVRIEHAGVNREIGLITRTGFDLSPAATRFADLLKKSLPTITT